MSGNLTPPITQDIMVLKAHVLTEPNLVPGNLVAVVSWNVVGELYLVSQWGDSHALLVADTPFSGECPSMGAS